MKESRKAAKDGGSSDKMLEMRKRYERAVEADQDNRDMALDDLKFVTVPGNQWDQKQREARKGRPCYEFPVLRSGWRQVVNDQKKARPGIKVRAVEDGDVEGAELRQGLIRNIESRSNAERAYDSGFELVTAAGFGAWRVSTEYSTDDAWDQDICVRPIPDPLASVWFDPDAKQADARDAMYAFVEESMSRDAFKAKYPKAEAVDFDSSKKDGYHDWFGEDSVRVAEYWRREPVQKTLLLLSDGRSVDKAELDEETVMQMMQAGITVTRERVCNTHKVIMSIVSGAEEIDGPHESVFDRIPIVPVYANRHFIEGKWTWCGMVRHARDSQKLVNYNFTSGQEALAKQHKSTPIVTPRMLEGAGTKALWDKSNAMDLPYLPITPDPLMPGGPAYLSAPPIHAAFAQMGQMAVDLVKSITGIHDASLGARSNETSGKAILARQQEGDTATFDYQDALSFAIQSTGELILGALPKVYDTPRAMRVLGKDGSEEWVKLYEQQQDGTVLNDLSAGKYDVTITTGASYDTQRMEFVDALVQMSQGNELVAQAVPDLIIGSMDFPKADEAAERLKLMLPPPVQQMLAKGKEATPEMMQLQQQMQQMQQMAEEQMQAMQEEMQQLQAKAQSKDDAMLKAQTAQQQAVLDEKKLELEWYEAETARYSAVQAANQADASLQQAEAAALAEQQNLAVQQEQQYEQQVAAAKPAIDPEEIRAMLAEHAVTLGETVAALTSRPRKTKVVRDKQGNIIGSETE